MTMDFKDKVTLIKKRCLEEKRDDPIEICLDLMNLKEIAVNGPEHHFLDGASFLTAYKNAGGDIDLSSSLDGLAARAEKMPGAMCGYWGVCGASASLGAALAIIHSTSPLSSNSFYKDNMALTSSILTRLGAYGGPRCCKRNAFLALLTAVSFVKEHYGIEMSLPKRIICPVSGKNNECLKEKCPFFPKESKD